MYLPGHCCLGMDQNQNIYCPSTSLQFLDEMDNKIFGTVDCQRLGCVGCGTVDCQRLGCVGCGTVDCQGLGCVGCGTVDCQRLGCVGCS